jgi:hypothetical protein
MNQGNRGAVIFASPFKRTLMTAAPLVKVRSFACFSFLFFFFFPFSSY